MTSLQLLCESRIRVGAELEHVWCLQENEAKLAWQSCVQCPKVSAACEGTSLGWETPLLCRSQHRLQVPMENQSFRSQPGAPLSSHTAALQCFVQIWALAHAAVRFSASSLSLYPQASVCSCLTFDGHRPLTGQCHSWEPLLFWKMFSLCDEGRAEFASLIPRWVGMDGR